MNGTGSAERESSGNVNIKVCDAICGSGKTSAVINMMNEDDDDVRYIFVTQYLTEVERIRSACSKRMFVSPMGDEDRGITKLADIHKLLEERRNISTTHSLFSSYTDETKRLISEGKYILVLDETVNVMSMSGLPSCDINILEKSGTVIEKDGMVLWNDDEYSSRGEAGRFREEMMKARSQNLIKYDDGYFFWSIPKELFTCFTEVYILTYLFEAQDLKYFFDINGMMYEVIGTKHDGNKYVFCDIHDMDRRRELRDKIHIVDSPKLNSIADGRTDLSMGWYKRGKNIDRLKKNLTNVFTNIFKARSDNFLWTTFKDFREGLSGKGYGKSFIPYNLRASNAYGSRRYLAYLVNNFPRPWITRYYKDNGVNVDADMYALSIAVQWIFRSAIRNNQEVWLYIPSSRMRYLVRAWLDNLAEGNDLKPVHYTEVLTYKRRRKEAGGGKD